MSRPRVLIVEDDPVIAKALSDKLTADGFAVWVEKCGQDGLATWRQIDPDVIVLDLILPDMDGFDVCSEIRRCSAVPLIVASGRTSEADRLCGLELGADDYVCKPFSLEELTCRLRALLNRWRRCTGFRPPPDHPLEIGSLSIDLTRHEVRKNGRPVHLTPKEFQLLCALARQANRTVSSRRLLWDVWGYDDRVRTRTLDVHIGRLRRKLEDDPRRPRLILTVPGVGYRLVTTDAKEEDRAAA
jgi:DNA-binding response OmpR family regulator